MYKTREEVANEMRANCEAIKTDKAITLLEKIAKQLMPLNTFEELQSTLTQAEMKETVEAKVMLHSLRECVEAEAEAKGYVSVQEMLDVQEKLASTQKRGTRLSIDPITGEITHSERHNEQEMLERHRRLQKIAGI